MGKEVRWIENLYKRRVDLPTGGYLIIEPTEALDGRVLEEALAR